MPVENGLPAAAVALVAVILKLATTGLASLSLTIRGEPAGWTAIPAQVPAGSAIGLNGSGASAPVAASMENALTVFEPLLIT